MSITRQENMRQRIQEVFIEAYADLPFGKRSLITFM